MIINYNKKGIIYMSAYQYTLSFHNQGGQANQSHNRRELHSIGANSNIDLSKSKNNITFVDEKIRVVYKNLFQKSVDEFNAKQKHQDRKIKDYYTKIDKSTKHTAYEIIIQIGSKKEGFPDANILYGIYSDYIDKWEQRNPNLKLIGAYLHFDEETPHLHIDYIPVVECSRGMSIQNSLTGALREQGFVTQSKHDTAQIQWEQSERDYIRDLCQDYNINLHEQGIGRKRHLSIQEYKDIQDIIGQSKKFMIDLAENYPSFIEGYNRAKKFGYIDDIEYFEDLINKAQQANEVVDKINQFQNRQYVPMFEGLQDNDEFER